MCRGEKSRKNGYIKVSDKVSGEVLLHAYLEITEFHFNTGAENRQKTYVSKAGVSLEHQVMLIADTQTQGRCCMYRADVSF